MRKHSISQIWETLKHKKTPKKKTPKSPNLFSWSISLFWDCKSKLQMQQEHDRGESSIQGSTIKMWAKKILKPEEKLWDTPKKRTPNTEFFVFEANFLPIPGVEEVQEASDGTIRK